MGLMRRQVSHSDYGSLAYGSVGTGWTTLFTLPPRSVLLVITNSLNQAVELSLNSGTNSFTILPASTGLILDLAQANLELSGIIQVKQVSAGAPSAGTICANVMGVE